MRAHTHMRAQTHTRTHTHMRAQTHIHTHARTNAHTYTHARTNTHTHTPVTRARAVCLLAIVHHAPDESEGTLVGERLGVEVFGQVRVRDDGNALAVVRAEDVRLQTVWQDRVQGLRGVWGVASRGCEPTLQEGQDGMQGWCRGRKGWAQNQGGV